MGAILVSTGRLTRAFEIFLKGTSELEAYRTEVWLESIGSRQRRRKIRRAGKNICGGPEADAATTRAGAGAADCFLRDERARRGGLRAGFAGQQLDRRLHREDHQ